MNYTWDNIVLDNFVKAINGKLEYVAVDGIINEETESAWGKIQDDYIRVMNSETVEIKRYKKLCFNYAVKLREWLQNPIENNRTFIELNKLFIAKKKLAYQIFTEDTVDWDRLIAQASISANFRIVSTEMRAKEFFNILKVKQWLNNL